MPCFNAKLSALALVAPLIGCASKSDEHYIVLHQHPAPRVAAHRPASRSTETKPAAAKPARDPRVQTAGTPAATSPETEPDTDPQTLTPAEKEELFRRFDAFLNQSGRH